MPIHFQTGLAMLAVLSCFIAFMYVCVGQELMSRVESGRQVCKLTVIGTGCVMWTGEMQKRARKSSRSTDDWSRARLAYRYSGRYILYYYLLPTTTTGVSPCSLNHPPKWVKQLDGSEVYLENQAWPRRESLSLPGHQMPKRPNTYGGFFFFLFSRHEEQASQVLA